MKASHLKQYIIEPTLKYLGLLNDSGVNLLLGIAAQESHMGEYLHQLEGGPALGIYQNEPRTVKDIWKNVLHGGYPVYSFKYNLAINIEKLMIYQTLDTLEEPTGIFKNQLEGNLYYATAITRVNFLRFKEPLPKADDIEGLAAYWKKYHNTESGKGHIVDFIRNYNKYVSEDLR